VKLRMKAEFFRRRVVYNQSVSLRGRDDEKNPMRATTEGRPVEYLTILKA
jgi:hypothetical protein